MGAQITLAHSPVDPSDAATALTGVARLSFWVGLAYVLVGASVAPFFFEGINWGQRFAAGDGWYIVAEIVVSTLTVAGGAIMGWVGLSALWRRRRPLRGRGMMVGASLILASLVCRLLLLAFGTFARGGPWSPYSIASVSTGVGRDGLAALPALAVLSLARSRQVRGLHVAVTPGDPGDTA